MPVSSHAFSTTSVRSWGGFLEAWAEEAQLADMISTCSMGRLEIMSSSMMLGVQAPQNDRSVKPLPSNSWSVGTGALPGSVRPEGFESLSAHALASGNGSTVLGSSSPVSQVGPLTTLAAWMPFPLSQGAHTDMQGKGVGCKKETCFSLQHCSCQTSLVFIKEDFLERCSCQNLVPLTINKTSKPLDEDGGRAGL